MKRNVHSTGRLSSSLQSGFTIVELVIMVTVIGILATLSVIGFNAYQQDARDGERESDISVLSEALEKYYDENGEYPACSVLTDDPDDISTGTLQGIEVGAFKAPKNDAENAIVCTDISSSLASDAYGYVADTSSECAASIACYSWTLQYREEGTGAIVEVDSRRNTTPAAVYPMTQAEAEAICAGAAPPVGYNIVTVSGALTNGTAGNDVIRGHATNADEIHGGDGNDVLCGSGGGDAIYGDAGNDMIIGGTGTDALYGGTGHDYIVAGDGADEAHGEDGNDTIYGGIAGDLLYGENGADKVYGEDGADQVEGGAGNDIVDGGANADQVEGDAGNDTLYGGTGADQLDGGADYDRGNDDGGGSSVNIEEVF